MRALWLLLLLAVIFMAVAAFYFVNRVLSFKLYKNNYPATLFVLLLNMFLLLSIAYLLPLDVFCAAQSSGIGQPNPINSTLSARAVSYTHLDVYKRQAPAAPPTAVTSPILASTTPTRSAAPTTTPTATSVPTASLR